MLANVTPQAGQLLDYANQTTLHPVGLSALAVALICAFVLPRRLAALPLVLLIAMIPSSQRVVFATLDFNLVRLMLIGVLLRLSIRGEWSGLQLRAVDALLLVWALWALIAFGLLHGPSSIVTRAGYMIEAVGAYFVGRALLRDGKAIRSFLQWAAVLSIGCALFFLVERTTGRNVFAVFGGVPEITVVREGRLRCQGPFSHPIMAGVYWASFLPLFAAAWFVYRPLRVWMVLAGTTSLLIIGNTASSTPVMAVVISIVAFALYPARSFTPLLRWGTLAALVFLHFAMDKGVHHLLARINVVGGSTGWHRYHLMDGAIRHFDEWAFFGTRSTAHWGWGLEDVTNQYVLEGVRGGFVAVALFVALLLSVFRLLSTSIRHEGDRDRRLMLWAFGVVLFTHCLNFIAVSYFGQMVAAFYFVVGATVSLAASTRPQSHTSLVGARRGQSVAH